MSFFSSKPANYTLKNPGWVCIKKRPKDGVPSRELQSNSCLSSVAGLKRTQLRQVETGWDRVCEGIYHRGCCCRYEGVGWEKKKKKEKFGGGEAPPSLPMRCCLLASRRFCWRIAAESSYRRFSQQFCYFATVFRW